MNMNMNMKIDNSQFSLMVIMNLTPNSFSDGGECSTKEKFFERFNYFKDQGIRIFDIGAESTAPSNEPVTIEEEEKRFENIFKPYLEENKLLDDMTLSIDTYRPSTFLKIYEWIKSNNSSVKIVWNDISGVLDKDCIQILKDCSDISYVYCHNSSKERMDSSHHMDNPFSFNEREAIWDIVDYFKGPLLKLSFMDSNRIIFDPCFGFSKILEHNHFLIKNLDKIFKSFDNEQKWLLGISRKSFLSELMGKKQFDMELLHSIVLSQWMRRLKNPCIFRVHNPSTFNAACIANENLF